MWSSAGCGEGALRGCEAETDFSIDHTVNMLVFLLYNRLVSTISCLLHTNDNIFVVQIRERVFGSVKFQQTLGVYLGF